MKMLCLLDMKWNQENQVPPFNSPPTHPFLYSIVLSLALKPIFLCALLTGDGIVNKIKVGSQKVSVTRKNVPINL